MTFGAAIAALINAVAVPLLPRWPIDLIPISLTLTAILSLVVNLWVTLDTTLDTVTDPEAVRFTTSLLSPETFDFIIIGAGSAGMIVANRISQNTDYKVLLLEAGGEPCILNNIPSLDFFLLNQPERSGGNTWIYPSVSQEHSSCNCDNNITLTTRGKMLGGSSSINFMMYVRGNKEDYNNWANDLNDEQWNYEGVLPYFKRSQDYNGYWPYDPEYHGKGGELNVATFDYHPHQKEFLDAGVEKGYKLGDYNGASQDVFSPNDVTTQDGWRESTYRAFYKDAPKRKNLVIRKYAFVTKINFKPGTLVADSVTYERQGFTSTVKATKEIILSAGTLSSPQILMLSGIGPKEHLESLQIPVKKDLPVGQNLQDHCYSIVGPFEADLSLNPDRDITPQAVTDFLLAGNGVIAAPAGLTGQAFLKSSKAIPNYSDLQLVQFGVCNYCALPRDLNRFFGINQDKLKKWLNPRCQRDAVFPVIILNRPKSVGELTLVSKNPHDMPNVNPKYLSHPDDIEALLEGFKITVDLYENTKALNRTMHDVPVPGCENIRFKSDDYYRCIIRHMSGSLYHHVGSVAMGAVVNSKDLTVIGTSNLRVIDASVLPKLPNANTNAPTMMVAEKGAQMILDVWGTKPPTFGNTQNQNNNNILGQSLGSVGGMLG